MRRSNEELAMALQQGDSQASADLFLQNEGLLRRWAGTIQTQYGLEGVIDDLVQEGGIALLDVAKKYDPSANVKLMSFTGRAVQQAMGDYAAALGSPLSVPTSRLRQIRATRYWALQAPSEWSREQVEELAAEKLGLPPSVIRTLLAQGETLLTYEPLEEQKRHPPSTATGERL